LTVFETFDLRPSTFDFGPLTVLHEYGQMEGKKIESWNREAMRMLHAGRSLLLALLLRFSHLSGVHERQPVGDDVQ
jgi:hypothetical protein